jgi:poly(beta-D-mannuronate) lyase
MFLLGVLSLIGSVHGQSPAVSSAQIIAPPDSFFSLVRERDRDVARGFYKKYLDVGGFMRLSPTQVRSIGVPTEPAKPLTMEFRFVVTTLRACILLLPLFVSAKCMAVESPGQIIDLRGWKLTLPIDTPQPGRPDEIVGPQLAGFSAAGFFFTSENGRAVIFRALCGGVATRGSSYPRCELREMQADGKKEAAWSTEDSAIHSLTASLAVTHLPAVKPHVVCAQIHDADDDLIEIRLEGKKLQVERAGQISVMLDRNYQLGAWFDLKIEAGGGHVRVFYTGEDKLDWQVARGGCYFKAGCYTQSNTKKGDAGDDYGEVLITKLDVTNRLP